MNALRDVEGELLKIPARSPDLNPIENIFHIVKNSLREDAIKKRVEAESFLQFQERVVCALKCIWCNVIDKTIESLPKRIVTQNINVFIFTQITKHDSTR